MELARTKDVQVVEEPLNSEEPGMRKWLRALMRASGRSKPH